MSVTVYLLLGSNEGDRERLIHAAIDDLTREAAKSAVLRSSLYETAAWGIEAQPPFLNAAIAFETALSPECMLDVIKQIEQKYGRQRTVVWGQRTLDVDILFYGREIIETLSLIVPHPQLPVRRFALSPLCEIAGDFVHPILHKTCLELLNECPDPLPVVVYSAKSARAAIQ